jgi:hypothetical protein
MEGAQMPLKESNVAHHFRATSYRYKGKIGLKQWLIVKTVGKMPMKICTNTGVRAAFYPPYCKFSSSLADFFS